MGDPKYGAASKTIATGSSSSDATQVSGPFLVPQDVRPLDNGTLLNNRYEIVALLGFGGMGAVYRAYDRELERDVALKTIRSDLANDPSILQRFKHELVLARQVTHRNVIRIFDIGEADGLRYITMEYLEGHDLANVLRDRGKLPASEAADIIAQVCEGLAAAHSEGVIHRDLKPSNIMVGANGRVWVMDFGLARTSGGDSGMTQTGALLGTVEYMSPEQARGDQLDQRSDIYTVGLIFYQLLTGEVPFKADSAIASLWKRMQSRPAPAISINPDVPAAVSAIVDRCLEVDREKRYSSATEILGDLARWDAKMLSHAFAPFPAIATPSAATVTKRLSPWMWVALAAFIVAVAIASYVGFRNLNKAQIAHAPVSLLVADFDNRTGDAVFDGTLEPAMTLALEGAPFISSFSRGDAHRIGTQIRPANPKLDEALGRLVAVREGLSVVVSGTIERAGSGVKVSVRALDATTGSVLLDRAAQVSSKDAVLREISDLASSVRKTLGDTTPESMQAAAAETFTSASLEAAHEYALAQDLNWAGKWDDAVLHYNAALRIDPNMGRALAGLAVVTANMGKRQDAESYFKQALAHIDQMTDREKMRTRGGYYLFMREPQKAIDEYSDLVKQFPADAAAYGNLALAHFYRRDMQRALQEGLKAASLAPKALLQKSNVALYADYAGDYPQAEKDAREVIAANPQYLEAFGALAIAQMGQGQLSEATKTYDQLKATGARGASIATTGLADMSLYEGKYGQASAILTDAIASDSKDKGTTAVRSIMLAEASLASGDRTKAVDAASRALTLDTQPSTQFAAAVVLVQAGQAARAASIADDLDHGIEPEPQLYGKLLRGEIALKNNDALKAIQSFQQAQQLTDSWLGHFGLGRAYLSAGKFVEANSEFESCLNRRGESSAVFLDDVPSFRYLPPVYYYLARTQEGLNSPAARDTYKKFIEMRKADDPLSLDAKRRIASQ